VNEEDYGGYYDYDYTKDRTSEDEVEEYSEGEAPEEEDYEENEDVQARADNNEDDEYGEGGRREEEDYNEREEDDGEDGDYEGGEEYEEDYEEESTDEDTEQLYRNYEILSEFYQKHFVDLRILDESCDGEVRPAPTINHGSVAQYLLEDNVLLPGKHYQRAIYNCQAGYAISSRTSDSMFCQEHGWTGMEPECEATGEVPPPTYTSSEEREDEEEVIEEGDEEEECSEGYVNSPSGECEDWDECSEGNGGCEESCMNKPGTYECTCPKGYDLSEDGHSCVDQDECLSNNGHGPCQDKCTNMDGYYHCSCPGRPGTRLAEDRHSCEEIDMCEENNGGCSHTCTSSHGQVYCSCPTGEQLGDDWKTCRAPPQCPEDSYLKAGECVPRCGEGDRWEGGTCVPDQEEREEYEYEPEQEDYTVEEEEEYEQEYDESDYEDDYKEEEEVLEEDPCSFNPCGQGECVIDGGGHRCRCPEGEEEKEGRCVQVTDPCEANPPPCSQMCSSTSGAPQCSCRPGFQLLPGPGGICRDIDECSLRPAICQQDCSNSPGSFRCMCREGFTQDPEDPTSCLASSCPTLDAPEGSAVSCSRQSQIGSVCRLRCRSGWARNGKSRWTCLPSGQWEEGRGRCRQVQCPAVELAPGLVVSPASCTQAPQAYKQKCRYTCSQGATLRGSKATFCGKKNQWVTRHGATSCEAPPQTAAPTQTSRPQIPPPPAPASTPAPPYILCPPDMKINLTGPNSRAEIRLPRPQTNADWESGVRAKPGSAKALKYWQEPGTVEIEFTAVTSSPGQAAVCRVRVEVRDIQPPLVTGCPHSKTVFLEPGEVARPVSWTEPQFTDNVKIEHVMASALPGSDMGLGKHLVIYQATDEAKNKEKCVFTITVVQFKQEHPGRKWVLCRVGNTGRQIRLLVPKVPPGCRLIHLSPGS